MTDEDFISELSVFKREFFSPRKRTDEYLTDFAKRYLAFLARYQLTKEMLDLLTKTGIDRSFYMMTGKMIKDNTIVSGE